MDISWLAPEQDGGSEVKNYLIERSEESENLLWTSLSSVEGSKTDFSVKDLFEGIKYSFRIKAINNAGESLPSDASLLLEAADKKGMSIE